MLLDLLFPLLMVYFFIIFLVALLYIIGAFAVGVLAAVLTLPVVYVTGYGLFPPRFTPGRTDTVSLTARLIHLFVGGVFGVGCLFGHYVFGRMVPFFVKYEFARLSPRLESLPGLTVGAAIVLVAWLGYLVYRRKSFDRDEEGRTTALLASARTAVSFCVCLIALAVLSGATLAL